MTSDVAGSHLPESLYGTCGCLRYHEIPTPKSKVQREHLCNRSCSNKHTLIHVCLRRLGVPPTPSLTEIEDHRACDSDRHVTVNNIQVILVCGRPGDRGGCLGAKAQSAGPARPVCVYYYRTYDKAVRGGGGGEWRTCAMRDDEPRPVWMSPLITHRVRAAPFEKRISSNTGTCCP